MSTSKKATQSSWRSTQDQSPVAGPSRLEQREAKRKLAEIEYDSDEDDQGGIGGSGAESRRDEEDDDDDAMSEDDEHKSDSGALEASDDDDDEQEIRQALEDATNRPKKKRKRALPQAAFGSLLSSLIEAPIPTKPLRPLHPPASAEIQERKALKALQAKRHEREERGHVADIIASWTPRPRIPFSQWSKLDGTATKEMELASGGADKERELRRLAQRGTVKLFNAIKAAQTTAVNAEAGATASLPAARSAVTNRAIKEASPAISVTPSTASTAAGVASAHSRSANLLGTKGKQEALANLSKASFLDLFKTAVKPTKSKLALV